MRIVLQEPGDEMCGAACLAMITGCDFSTAQHIVGYSRISARALLAILKSRGFHQAESELALAFWRGPKRRGHWVVKKGTKWFDPDRGILNRIPEGWRLERHWPLQRIH